MGRAEESELSDFSCADRNKIHVVDQAPQEGQWSGWRTRIPQVLTRLASHHKWVCAETLEHARPEAAPTVFSIHLVEEGVCSLKGSVHAEQRTDEWRKTSNNHAAPGPGCAAATRPHGWMLQVHLFPSPEACRPRWAAGYELGVLDKSKERGRRELCAREELKRKMPSDGKMQSRV